MVRWRLAIRFEQGRGADGVGNEVSYLETIPVAVRSAAMVTCGIKLALSSAKTEVSEVVDIFIKRDFPSC